jgi:hypothetical protein
VISVQRMGTEWKQTMVENGPLNTRADVDVRFGSLAAPFDNVSSMSASGGKAAPQQIDFESNILNVCFSQ